MTTEQQADLVEKTLAGKPTYRLPKYRIRETSEGRWWAERKGWVFWSPLDDGQSHTTRESAANAIKQDIYRRRPLITIPVDVGAL